MKMRNLLSKKYIITASVITLTLFLANAGDACTRVFYNVHPGFLTSGRNLDYFGPADPALVVTPRGTKHGDSKISWKARYGSVIIFADDVFPMEGMNEKGLVAHTQFFSQGSQTESDHQDKPILTSDKWVSYLLDNNATVSEAIKSLQNVRLKAVLLPIDYVANGKHIAIEDATGDSAIIEIVDGKVMIYHNKSYTVMTNFPSYDKQLAGLAAAVAQKKYPLGWSPADRLVRASMDLARMPESNNETVILGNLLSILNNTAFPINYYNQDDASYVSMTALAKTFSRYSKYPQNNHGVATYWQALEDISHKVFYFKTIDSPFPVFVSFDETNFTKGQPVLKIKHLDQYPLQNWQGNILRYAKPSK